MAAWDKSHPEEAALTRSLQPDHSLKAYHPPQYKARLVDWIWEHSRKGSGHGCLDAAATSVVRLSMSGYEKPQDSYVYGMCVKWLM